MAEKGSIAALIPQNVRGFRPGGLPTPPPVPDPGMTPAQPPAAPPGVFGPKEPTQQEATGEVPKSAMDRLVETLRNPVLQSLLGEQFKQDEASRMRQDAVSMINPSFPQGQPFQAPGAPDINSLISLLGGRI